MELENNKYQILKKILYQYFWSVEDSKIFFIIAILFIISYSCTDLYLSGYLNKQLVKIFDKESQNLTDITYDERLKMVFVHLSFFISVTAIKQLQKSVGMIFLNKIKRRAFSLENLNTYKRYLSMSPDIFQNELPSETVNFISRRSDAILSLFDAIFINLTVETISIIFSYSYFFYQYFRGFPFLILFLTSTFHFIIIFLIQERRGLFRILCNQNLDLLITKQSEGFFNYETILMYNGVDNEILGYKNEIKGAELKENIFYQSLCFLNFIGVILGKFPIVLWLFLIFITGIKYPVTEITLFLSLSSKITAALNKILSVYKKANIALANILDRPIPNIEAVKKVEICEKLKDKCEIVSLYSQFSYSFSLNIKKITIKAGEKIFITGQNGSGKTSFIKGLLGFIDVEGEILWDNQLVNLKTASFRNLFSYTPQSPILFDKSVMLNILYGKPSYLTEEDIYKAAKLLGIHQHILKLSDGYNTICGKKGNNLSAGQSALIFFLREFLKNSSIFIMDETLNSLDESIRSSILNYLLKYDHRGLIYISHYLSFIDKFENVLFMENGVLRYRT